MIGGRVRVRKAARGFGSWTGAAILALAGSLAAKKRASVTTGTFPTTGPLWIGLLVGVILIVGALTYFPAYSLGPIIEHIQMHDGVTFSTGL